MALGTHVTATGRTVRRFAWTVLLTACAVGAVAAWLGVSFERFVDAVDDSTSPPVFPG